MSMFMLGAVNSLIRDTQYADCMVATMSCYACQFFTYPLLRLLHPLFDLQSCNNY